MGVGRGGGVGWGEQIYEFQIQIFRFSISGFYFVWKYFRKNMLVIYQGINIKGVLERPGTKWKVLRTISSTLKFQECHKS